MKSKKLISFLFIVLFVFSFSIAALAAENENVLSYAVESSDSIVYSGDTITVDLVITENTGFVWSRVDVVYDVDHLTYVADGLSTEGTVVDPDALAANHNNGKIAVIIGDISAVMNPSKADVYDKTGKVISLTFKVVEGYEGPLSIVTDLDPMNTYSPEGEMDFVLTYGKEEPLTCIDEATHVHTEEIIPGYAATCTEPGLTDGKKCTVCKKTYEEQQTIDPKGHLDDIVLEAVAPTCTETGLTAGTKCSACDTITLAQEVVPAKGHLTDIEIEGVEPTCTEDGLTAGAKCSACGVVSLEQEVIPATGHDWKKKSAVDATCTSEGKKALWVCKVCDEVHSKYNGEATDKADHELSDHYVNTDPDNHWKKCENCDYTTSKEAHTFENAVCTVCGYGCNHQGGTATCTKKAVCELCNAEYGDFAAHTPGAGPTCTEDQKCTACSAVIAAATDHTLEDVAEKAPTCTEAGHKAYQKCSKCDYTTYEEVPATGSHTYGEWETVTEPTTEAEGQKKRTCTACGAEETESIPVLEKQAEEDGGFPVWLIIVIAAGAVVIIAIVVILVIRKKKQK